MSNYTHIEGNIYIVRTQAGFNSVLKERAGDWMVCYGTTFKELKDSLVGYPTEYPSIVSLTVGYCGYEHWVASCTPLSKIKGLL